MTSLYNINSAETFSGWYNPTEPEQNFSDEIEATANHGLIILLFSAAMIFLMIVCWIFRR